MLTPSYLIAAQAGYLSGCLVALHVPRPAEAAVALVPLRGLLREIDLVVQVRYAPGAETPTILLVETGEARLDPLLRKWVQ